MPASIGDIASDAIQWSDNAGSVFGDIPFGFDVARSELQS